MNFSIGDRLRVDGDEFRVVGKIVFDGMWVEYRLIAQAAGQERWLSIDDHYREYSISRKANSSVSFAGYHVVDEGTEVVMQAEGNVDVSKGDKAVFTEYEDVTTEKIISVERWDDEEEISVGYYLDADEIQLISSANGAGRSTVASSGSAFVSNSQAERNSNILMKAIVGLIAGVVILGNVLPAFASGKTIAKYLKGDAAYTYKTSITGADNQKADVYSTTYSLDAAARDIIMGVNGDTQDIQQNTEDGDSSITILTDSEYCIIYTSEDNETLVQISTREYAYRNDNDLYRANRYSNRYYRRYYYSKGYTKDTTTYDDYSSPYSSYTDSTISSSSYSNTYNTYSSSIRQSSTSTRTSSGGGLSSGK